MRLSRTALFNILAVSTLCITLMACGGSGEGDGNTPAEGNPSTVSGGNSGSNAKGSKQYNDRLLGATLWMQRAAEYQALCYQAFNSAALHLNEALNDPNWTAAAEQGDDLRRLTPAVVLDIDETVLDNSYYQARLILENTNYGSDSWKAWSDEAAATPIPGALDFCKFAESIGVKVIYVTNRKEPEREATAKNLREYGFPLDADTGNLILRTGDSEKGPRRTAVTENFRVVMLIGDSLGDHHSGFHHTSEGERNPFTAENKEKWGERWIVLPNPGYGDWDGAILDYNWGVENPDAVRRAALYLKRSDRGASSDANTVGANQPASATSSAMKRNPRVTLDVIGQRHELISAGPMVGGVAHSEAWIWLQTKSMAEVQISYWPESRPSESKMTRVIEANRENDHIACFRLSGLDYGTEYRYEAYINGENASVNYPSRFLTPTHYYYRNNLPDFSFTFGSCGYKNDPKVDRLSADGTAQQYGGDYELYQAIASREDDFMLWLGDNLYYSAPDWTSESGMRARNAKDRSLAHLQPMLANRANFAIWDDHDYGPNNSNGSFALKRESQAVFEDYWPNAGYGAGQDEGTYYSFTWNDCDFFMLDNRYFRAEEGSADGMLGAAQMKWLKEALAQSHATFKFIACGSQMVNPVVLFESFGKYPEEKQELLDWIDSRSIGGVVFLSGDRHLSELLKLEREGKYPLYEYTSSPMGSGFYGGHADEQNNPARVPGTLIGDKRSYGRIEISGEYGSRTATLYAHDKDGNEIWKHVIKQSELRPSQE